MTFAIAGHLPSWAVAFLAVHLFLFNLFELLVFERYDFVAMYSSRVAYYVVWHIVWGYVRLRVLPH